MIGSRAPTLGAVAVTFGFPRRPDFLRPVHLDVERRQCWGIIGPNGAGKSTLLRLLAGLLIPKSGDIHYEGRSLRSIPPRELARAIAFLPQHAPVDLAATCREVVLMGRFPHRRFGLFDSAADHEIADRAMVLTQTTQFADRPLATLSGGEAQRVHIAAAIAQQPAILLLDEPTASLDLYHQISIFGLLRDLTGGGNLAVVAVTHDINLAARFCSHVLLLDDGRTIAAGRPDDVVTAAVLEPVYRVRLTDASGPAASDQKDAAAQRWIVPLTTSGLRSESPHNFQGRA